MNERQFETKMEQDGTRVKNAMNTMVGDGVSQLKNEFNDFSGTLTDNAKEVTAKLRKNVNSGLNHYNTKAQEVADRLPFGISKNVIKYPWVVISLGLFFGFMLGILLKPSRQ